MTELKPKATKRHKQKVAPADQEIMRPQQDVQALEQELDVLRGKLQQQEDREQELRALLLDAHEQLLRRDEELMLLFQTAEQPGAQTNPAAVRMVSQYREIVHTIRKTVKLVLPPAATVLVVSKGDDELLKLEGPRGWHFPQLENGVYAGYYPAESAHAVFHLEALRAKGAEFLLFPQPAFWWLDHYTSFKEHLERCYQKVVADDSCIIFALKDQLALPQPEVAASQVEGSTPMLNEQIELLRTHIAAIVATHIPDKGAMIVATRGEHTLLNLGGRTTMHFPQAENGQYTNRYPLDSSAAIAQLETLRERGGMFLIVPKVERWLLSYYPDFGHHLESVYRRIWHDEQCTIYHLAAQVPSSQGAQPEPRSKAKRRR